MDTLKVNVSLPAPMYARAKKMVEKGKYNSFSEVVRSGLRRELYQEELNPDFVKSVRQAERSGYKRFDSADEMIASLHSERG